MKRTFLAVLCAALAACGGDDAADPSSVKFDYGTPTPVTAGSDAESAALTGEAGFADALLVAAETDPALAEARANSVVTLPDTMATAVMDSFGPAAPALSTSPLLARAGDAARSALAARIPAAPSPALLDACVTVTPGRITYANCTETVVDGTYTTTVTMNGWFTFTASGGNATLDWDLDVRVVAADAEISLDVTNAYKGSLTSGPGTLAGASRSDLDARYSAQGYGNFDFALTHLVDYELEFQAEPFCLTGGTLELRRVWRERLAGVPAEQMPDQAVLFTFGPGCGFAQVAWGTR